MLDRLGQPSSPNARLSGFRDPTDAEIGAGVSALAKILGSTESAKPSWIRRLALGSDGAWLVKIDECPYLAARDAEQFNFDWVRLGVTRKTPTAYELAAGVRLLAGAENPEIELQRREKVLAAYRAQVSAREAEQERRQSESATAAQRHAEAAAKFDEKTWLTLVPWQRAFYLLALKVAERDPQLAQDLRAVASSVTAYFGDRVSVAPMPWKVWK